ncbi:YdcF family protein [Novosphingobium sp. M1R2S20]|uniref:YdcF family protein n=1 Tax=Novosphingobium rhizovicinum TaxID=3228928 RepID=A0ABV3RBK8_9SPHN
MFRRIAAFFLLLWFFGFLWFAVTLPQPAGAQRTDAVIVLTGGPGRIPHAIDVLRRDLSPRLLVSGVDPEVRPVEFAREYDVPPRLMDCCITLGYRAFDTRSNAVEAANWLGANRARSVRVVTVDWHMRRAAYELGRELPRGIKVLRDAVRSEPSLRTLFLEYHKLLARWLIDTWQEWRQ